MEWGATYTDFLKKLLSEISKFDSHGAAAEAIPCSEQDCDAKQRKREGRWAVRVVPIVDGVAESSQRKQDAEDGGDRPSMAPRGLHGAKAGASWRRHPPGSEYLFAIGHGILCSPQMPAYLSSLNDWVVFKFDAAPPAPVAAGQTMPGKPV